VHFNHGFAVFEFVFGTAGFIRQLARLAHGYEGLLHIIREGRAEHEPARFRPGDYVELNAPKLIPHVVHGPPEVRRVLQKRGDVAEKDTFYREVLYIPDSVF
jgi:hypothetical protein